MEDNIAQDQSGKPVVQYQGKNAIQMDSRPLWYKNLQVIPAVDVRESIVENAGARPWDRDETDKRIIEEMVKQKGKVIDSENEVGGYPTSKPTYAKFIEKEWDLKTMTKAK